MMLLSRCSALGQWGVRAVQTAAQKANSWNDSWVSGRRLFRNTETGEAFMEQWNEGADGGYYYKVTPDGKPASGSIAASAVPFDLKKTQWKLVAGGVLHVPTNTRWMRYMTEGGVPYYVKEGSTTTSWNPVPSVPSPPPPPAPSSQPPGKVKPVPVEKKKKAPQQEEIPEKLKEEMARYNGQNVKVNENEHFVLGLIDGASGIVRSEEHKRYIGQVGKVERTLVNKSQNALILHIRFKKDMLLYPATAVTLVKDVAEEKKTYRRVRFAPSVDYLKGLLVNHEKLPQEPTEEMLSCIGESGDLVQLQETASGRIANIHFDNGKKCWLPAKSLILINKTAPRPAETESTARVHLEGEKVTVTENAELLKKAIEAHPVLSKEGWKEIHTKALGKESEVEKDSAYKGVVKLLGYGWFPIKSLKFENPSSQAYIDGLVEKQKEALEKVTDEAKSGEETTGEEATKKTEGATKHSKEELEAMTVMKLKEILKEKELPTSGRKEELVDRLLQN